MSSSGPTDSPEAGDKVEEAPGALFQVVVNLEKAMHLLAYLCLALLLLYPLLPAILAPLDDWVSGLALRGQGQHALTIFLFWLQHQDAGGEMGLGPWVLRTLALALVALPGIFPTLPCALPRRLLFPLTGFLALSFLSATLCSHPYDGIVGALDTVLVCGVGLRTSQLLDDKNMSGWLSLLPVVALCHLPSLFIQFCFHPEADSQMRGAFHHPNMMASYLLLVAPIVLLRALQSDAEPHDERPRGIGAALAPTSRSSLWSHWRRGAYWLLFGGIAASVALSGSRAAQGGLTFILSFCVFFATTVGHTDYSTAKLARAASQALGVTVFTLLGWVLATRAHSDVGVYAVRCFYALSLLNKCRKLSNWRPVQLLASCVLAYLLVITAQSVLAGVKPTSGNVLDRGSHAVRETDSSLQARLAFWQGAWLAFCDHPALGVGPAGFHRFYPQYQTDCRWFSKFPHSLPLAVLCENGLPAFTLLLMAACVTLSLVLQRLSQDTPRLRLHRLSALLAVLALQGVSLVDVQWQFPVFPLTLGFLLGCCWMPSSTNLVPENEPKLLGEESSPWTLRPAVILNQTACAVFLIFQLVNLRGAQGEYYHQISKLAMQQRHFKEATLLSRTAIDHNPWQGEYFHQLGLAMLAEPASLTGEDKKFLLSVAQICCRLDSHRAVHQDMLAKVLTVHNDLVGAERAARNAISLDSANYPTFYQSLAQMHSQVGDARGARLILEGATYRFPATMMASVFDFRASALRRQLSEVYAQLGDIADPQAHPQDAEPIYARALELDPESFQAQLGQGVCHFQLGQYEKALPNLEFVRNRDVELTVVYAMLAQCYDHLGRKKEAAEASQRYQELEKKAKK